MVKYISKQANGLTPNIMDKKQKRFQYDPYKVIGIPLLAFFFLFSVLFMKVIADIRIKELKIEFQNANEKSKISQSLSLISRYLLIKERQKFKKETLKQYLKEGSSMVLMSDAFSVKSLHINNFQFLEGLGLVFINMINWFLGEEPVHNLAEDQGYKLMEIAYFYERKRIYSKAIVVYNASVKYFKNNLPKRAFNLLHRGFCHSLNGGVEMALMDYDSVYKIDGDGDLGTVAVFLAGFLRQLQGKQIKVDKMNDTVDKGIAYYWFMAYRKSIKILSKMEKNETSQRLYFFRGRSYEELGSIKKAIIDYKKVLGLNQKSEYARKANRRLFLLSTIYARDKKLKKQSKAFAKKIKDEKFIIQSEKMQRAIDYNKIEKIKADKTTIKTIEFIREQSDSNFTVPELTKYVERIHKKLKSEKFSDSKKDDIKENRKKQERIRARIKKVSLTKKMTKKEKKKIFRNLE